MNCIDSVPGAERVQGLKVLLAEDNIVNEKVAVHLLHRLGCEVKAVRNGRLAVEAVVSYPCDVILMDLQMPEMDGLAATAEIRKLPTPQRSLPIIAVTANAMRGDRETCLHAGMDDYLSKPVSGAGLAAMLLKWDVRFGRQPSSDSTSSPTKMTIYDPEVLGETFGDDLEFVASVLAEYMQSAAVQIESIETAVANRNADALERSAHTLKGSSRTVGALRIAEVAAEFELLSRSGGVDMGASILDRLRDEFRLLLQELEPRIASAA